MNALSEKVAKRFGIHYDNYRNVTDVGVRPLVNGAVIFVFGSDL